MLLDLPLTRPALMLLGMSFVRSGIRTARKAFIEKALYSNKSREVWKVIHRVLKPSARPLRIDPDELNDFFATAAQRTLETQATPIEDFTCLIDNLPDVPSGGMRFQLSPVTSENVLQVIKNLRSRIYDRIVLRARIRYLPASSSWLLSAWQSP